MKKYYRRLAALLLCTSLFTGCGDKGQGTKGAGEALDSTETDFSGALDYNPGDYVTLGDYKDLHVQYPLPYVSDEDMQMYINELLEDNIEYNEVDRAAKSEDYVNIDFKGTIDGKEFENGSDSDYDFTLGEGEFPEDFEKNIVGMKKGESKSFQMTFPDDYVEDLAGKTADFDVTLNSVSEEIMPEYTDELVADCTDYGSIEDYEEAVREELILTAQQESEEEAKNNALALAVENSKVEGYPKDLYAYCYHDVQEICEGTAQLSGMEPGEVAQMYYGVDSLEDAAVSEVNEAMVIQAIAEKEKLTVSEKDYEKEAESLALDYGYSSLEEFKEDYSDIEIRLLLVRENVLAFLYESADLEEVSKKEYYGEDEFLMEETESTEMILEEDLE